ncbi:MAG: DnaA ATPase domain-containing protein, partial [Alsobacter sp.]
MLNSLDQNVVDVVQGEDRTGGADRSQSWDRVRRRLRAELGDDVFSSWFGRLELVDVCDGVAYLSVPTRFLKSWIQSHYTDRLRALLVAECAGVVDLALAVRTAVQARPALRVQTDVPSTGPAPRVERAAVPVPAEKPVLADADGLQGSPLDRRLTFASFLVGRSNALAHAAGERVARIEAGAAPLYNPLYVHASVGLGKTHLLQAVAHDVLAAGKRVIYLTADRFMYGFVAALKAQTALAFKERLRGIDLLVIDD